MKPTTLVIWLLVALAFTCCSRRDPVAVEVRLVDSRTCAGCHADVYKNYVATGMGRSFYRPDAQPAIEDWSGNNHFVHDASRRFYRMIRRDGKLAQQRYELDSEGKEINLFERDIHFVIGSGNHARSYLHRTENGELTQLPVTWYTQERRWGMSPGFDRARHFDFSRRIDHGCMFCHNAYPRVAEGTDRYGAISTFPRDLPSGIDCQRCHGSGASHIDLASKKAPPDKIRAAIVNPRRLSAARQLDVCLQCHLETTSSPLPASTRRFGRSAYSFRPGEALSEYIVHFDHPPGAGHDDKFEINGSAYRLRKSACFLRSDGKLTCTSCHDPHKALRGEKAVGHYRARCMSCHTQLSATAHRQPASIDCAGCHMPKRRTDDAVHVVMTDHLIARRLAKRDLLAPLRESEAIYRGRVALYLPNDVPPAERDGYMGTALVSSDADRNAGIGMLERAPTSGLPAKALAELAGAYVRENRVADAITAYRKALAHEPGMALARYNLAQALERSGELEQARKEYEQVIREHSTFPDARFSLANLMLRLGDRIRGEALFRDAIHLRPDYADAHNNLGILLLEGGRLDEAAREFDAALRVDPGLASAHANTAKLNAARGQTGAAIKSVLRALEIDPADPQARVNYGRLLYAAGRVEEAIAEFRRTVRQSPDFVEGHRSLGVALGEQGDLRGAIREFKEVLRVLPGDGEARQNLEAAQRMSEGRN